MSEFELPALPIRFNIPGTPAPKPMPPLYAADQMREYGEACARAAMEHAAQICARYAAEWIKAPGLAAEFRAHGASDCEEEIRNCIQQDTDQA